MFFGDKVPELPVIYLPDEHNRPSSAPFLSGDTFRNLCDFAIEPEGTSVPVEMLPPLTQDSLIFIKVDIFHRSKYLKALFYWINTYNFPQGKGPTIIIHNGDIPPDERINNKLVSLGARIFSVNTHIESTFIHGIPIGLENAHYNRSGRTELYQDFLSQPMSNDHKQRLIFSAFSSKTNPRQRKKLIRNIEKSEHEFSGSSLSTEEYIAEVKRSYFVLSPEGNGPDCHRTWESIYLGAIPIIPKGVLPQSIINNLPIWEVDNWGQALHASNEELLQIYQSLKSIPIEQSLLPYWADKFNKGK